VIRTREAEIFGFLFSRARLCWADREFNKHAAEIIASRDPVFSKPGGAAAIPLRANRVFGTHHRRTETWLE